MNITHGFAQTPSSNTGSPSFTLDNNQTTTENPRKFPFDVVSKPKAKLSACVDWLQGVGCTNPAQFDFLVGEIGTSRRMISLFSLVVTLHIVGGLLRVAKLLGIILIQT